MYSVHVVLASFETFVCCLTGKELYICETALHDFRAILGTVGGPGECARAEQLLSRVTVIPDAVSPRIAALLPSAKIKERAKVRMPFK